MRLQIRREFMCNLNVNRCCCLVFPVIPSFVERQFSVVASTLTCRCSVLPIGKNVKKKRHRLRDQPSLDWVPEKVLVSKVGQRDNDQSPIEYPLVYLYLGLASCIEFTYKTAKRSLTFYLVCTIFDLFPFSPHPLIHFWT